MFVTKLHVSGRSGGNGTPSYGDAHFSDGKTYTWLRNAAVGIVFFSHRKRHGSWEMFSFRSPQRALALTTYLNGV